MGGLRECCNPEAPFCRSEESDAELEAEMAALHEMQNAQKVFDLNRVRRLLSLLLALASFVMPSGAAGAAKNRRANQASE